MYCKLFVCIPGAEMTELADKLNYDREVIRVWFCNKRQALKNTIKKLKQEGPSYANPATPNTASSSPTSHSLYSHSPPP
mgnify:FL=1